jgi:hypothetical protein
MTPRMSDVEVGATFVKAIGTRVTALGIEERHESYLYFSTCSNK